MLCPLADTLLIVALLKIDLLRPHILSSALRLAHSIRNR